MAIVTVILILAFFVLITLIATIGDGLRSFERSEIRIADNIDISAEALSISEAMLNVTTYLDNGGDAKSGEIEVLIKAYDADTNLLVASNQTKVGEIEGRVTKSVRTYLNLLKEGGYRLEIVVFEDGKGIQRGETKIYGLSRLEPPATAKISLRGLDFFVQTVKKEGSKEYAVINTTLYIDNLGKDVSDLRALIKARDNETRLIADKSWEDLRFLKSGTTSLHYATLNVLNGRDYIFEVQIWQSERIIKESSGMVLLSPFVNRTVMVEAKEKTVEISPEIEISDFIRPRGGYGYEEDYGTPVYEKGAYPAPQPPGFEVLPAVSAFIIAAWFILLRNKRKMSVKEVCENGRKR